MNGIASWMTLKSSEVKNFLSWQISTTLKYFLVASASLHFALPHFIRPMLGVLKIVPKIIFQSPEFNRTIFFSRLLTMTKKSQSFCHWVSEIRLSSWLNVSPNSLTNRYSSCSWASRGRSSWFCFSLWSAWKSKYIRFQCKFFRLRLRGLLLVVVVLFVAQIRDQLIQSMTNSDPRVRIVFVYRLNSDFHSIFTLQVTLVVTSNTGPILVFRRIQPFGADDFSSLGKVYSRHATNSVNCENSSVSFVMKYCPTSTVVRNPASGHF